MTAGEVREPVHIMSVVAGPGGAAARVARQPYMPERDAPQLFQPCGAGSAP